MNVSFSLSLSLSLSLSSLKVDYGTKNILLLVTVLFGSFVNGKIK